MKTFRNILVTMAVMSIILVGAMYANKAVNHIREARWERERLNRVQDIGEQTESLKTEIDAISHMDRDEIIGYIEEHALKELEEIEETIEDEFSEDTASPSASVSPTISPDSVDGNEGLDSSENIELVSAGDPWADMDWETGISFEDEIPKEEPEIEDEHAVYNELYENEEIEVIGENGGHVYSHSLDDDGSADPEALDEDDPKKTKADNESKGDEEASKLSNSKKSTAIIIKREDNEKSEKSEESEVTESSEKSEKAEETESPEKPEKTDATEGSEATEKPEGTASPENEDEAAPSESPALESSDDGWESGSYKENVNRVADLGMSAVAELENNKNSESKNSDNEDSVNENSNADETEANDDSEKLPWEPKVSLSYRQKYRSSYDETKLWIKADDTLLENTKIDLSGFKIACIGDSVTQGTNLEDDPDYPNNTYPSVLGRTLKAESVTNLGIGGTSLGRYWDQAFCDRYQEIPEDTDIIIVFGGYNDGYCLTEDLVGSMENRAERTLYGDVNDLFEGLANDYPHAQVIVMTPFPNLLHDVLRKERENLLPQTVVVNCLLELANEYGYYVIDNYNSNLLDSHDADIVSEYIPDSVHPNAEGYEILGRHVAAELIRIVDKKIADAKKAEIEASKEAKDDAMPSESPLESPSGSPLEAVSGKPTGSALEDNSEKPSESASESASEKPTESPGEDAENSPSEKPSESPEAGDELSPSASPTEGMTEDKNASASPKGTPSSSYDFDKKDSGDEKEKTPSESPIAEDKHSEELRDEDAGELSENPSPSPTESKIIIIGRD